MNKIIMQIPNMITSMNLISGIYAIYYSFQADYDKVLLFVVLAMMFDALDGRAARMLKIDGDFGKEYDSLADVVTFGVAPMMLLINTHGITAEHWHFLLFLMFPIAGAWRLARFNAETYKAKEHFVGVPITLAGFLMVLVTAKTEGQFQTVDMVVMVILSYLMVSKIKVPNFKQIKFNKKIYLYVCTLIMTIYAIYIATQKHEYTLLIIPIVLTVAVPLNHFKKRRKKKRIEKKDVTEN